ncbi:hypothetical protein ACJW30_05G108600 [Castanea mollissima]
MQTMNSPLEPISNPCSLNHGIAATTKTLVTSHCYCTGHVSLPNIVGLLYWLSHYRNELEQPIIKKGLKTRVQVLFIKSSASFMQSSMYKFLLSCYEEKVLKYSMTD